MDRNWNPGPAWPGAQRISVPSADEMKAVPRRKIYNAYYNEYVRQKVAHLIEAEGCCDDISPFNDQWLAEAWKRVADIEMFPVASIGAEKQIRKYGHFLYGMNGNVLYLAVPGRNNGNEWPDRGRSGFVLWQPIRGSDEYGYWCMVIESKTGVITEIS
jgi:hypothetical protein